MKRLLAAGVAVAALIATGAHAQSALDGAYIAGDVGYSWNDGFKTLSPVRSSDGSALNWVFSRDETPVGYVRLGKRVAPNWRVELEGGYRKGDINGVRGTSAQPIGLCAAGPVRSAAAPTCNAPKGSLRVGSAMVNALYDVMPDSRVNPFLGIGVGRIEIHNKVYGQLSGVPAGAAAIQNASIDDVDETLAVQGILGVSVNMSENWALDLTGRYMQSGKVNFGAVTNRVSATGTVTDTGTHTGNFRDGTVTVGVRYTFGSAPPPPPPPPEGPRGADPPDMGSPSRRAFSASSGPGRSAA